jgi:CubicO group peptidase (beta-lactamase class C family)
MAQIRWILFLFLSILSVSFGENLSEVNQAVEKSLKFWNAPGAAVVIIKDGRIALTKGYGVKDFQTQSPVDEHTLFQIASLTKPITAYLT